jgi:hypothetical protein
MFDAIRSPRGAFERVIGRQLFGGVRAFAIGDSDGFTVCSSFGCNRYEITLVDINNLGNGEIEVAVDINGDDGDVGAVPTIDFDIVVNTDLGNVTIYEESEEWFPSTHRTVTATGPGTTPNQVTATAQTDNWDGGFAQVQGVVPEDAGGDIVLTDLRVPSTVTRGETVTIEIETECVDGNCEQETLTLTVDGDPVFTGGSTPAGPFEEGRTRTFTADVTFDTAGTVDVVAELDGERLRSTVEVGEPEPEFDPGQVFVPSNDCGVSPQEVTPPADISLSATVRNRNEVPAAATVEWTWEGRVIAQAGVNVSANSQALAQANATIEREGRGQVRAEVTNASESIEGLHPIRSAPPTGAFPSVF